MAWLLRDGEVLASVEVASSLVASSRGLLGQEELRRGHAVRATRALCTRSGCALPIDVAFLSNDLRGDRHDDARAPEDRSAAARPVAVLEAQAGAFARWQLVAGDQLEIKG